MSSFRERLERLYAAANAQAQADQAFLDAVEAAADQERAAAVDQCIRNYEEALARPEAGKKPGFKGFK